MTCHREDGGLLSCVGVSRFFFFFVITVSHGLLLVELTLIPKGCMSMSTLPNLCYDIWVVQKDISYYYIPVVVVVIYGVGC